MKNPTSSSSFQSVSLLTKLKGARNATSTSVLWLGLIVGIVGSVVVMLNWFSGAAIHHGSRELVGSVVGTIIILGFTIDSEIRLHIRMLHK